MTPLRRAKLPHVAIASLVSACVLLPALINDFGFGEDFSNHMWLVWYQGLAIGNTGHPTLFLSSSTTGVLQPLFGFYGGTLYAIFGGLSALLGDRPTTAFFVSLAVFAAMSYRGLWLFARFVGVGPFAAHLPAFLFLTSGYYITDLYARGAWTEVAALSSIPFVLAYGLLLLRDPWSPGRVMAFVWGAVLLSGSHNITLLWSLVLLALAGPAAYLATPRADRPSFRRITAVFAVAVAGAGVNGWFLLFNLRRGADTLIAGSEMDYSPTKGFNAITNILSLGRPVPEISTTAGLIIAAPVLGLLFGLAVALAGGASKDEGVRSRQWWVSACAIVVLVVLMTMGEAAWTALGPPLTLIQFPYRLAGYLAIACSVFLAMSLRQGLPGRGAARRGLLVGGSALVVITCLQAVAQLFPPANVTPVARDPDLAFARGAKDPPSTWYDGGSYGDRTRGEVIPAPGVTPVVFPIPEPGVTSVTGRFDLPPAGVPTATNALPGPWAARFEGTGFYIAGRAGAAVVVARSPGTTAPTTITARASIGPIQTLGTVVSALSIVALLGLVGTLALRRRRGRAPLFGADRTQSRDPASAPDREPDRHTAGA